MAGTPYQRNETLYQRIVKLLEELPNVDILKKEIERIDLPHCRSYGEINIKFDRGFESVMRPYAKKENIGGVKNAVEKYILRLDDFDDSFSSLDIQTLNKKEFFLEHKVGKGNTEHDNGEIYTFNVKDYVLISADKDHKEHSAFTKKRILSERQHMDKKENKRIYDKTLTPEAQTDLADELISLLPGEVWFVPSNLSGWYFNNPDAENIEHLLYSAGTEVALEKLGDFYSKLADVAVAAKGGGRFISSSGSASSADYLTFWAIRSYLAADKEDKAINALKKHKDCRSAISTVVIASEKRTTPEEIRGRGFDLPDLDSYQEFYKTLRELG
ncbi:MAG: hypothetical protein GXP63_02295 [DPANN group archaeon]|nr:hypothetical protein [DPANN group archaeon]